MIIVKIIDAAGTKGKKNQTNESKSKTGVQVLNNNEIVPLLMAVSKRQPIGMVEAAVGNPGKIHFSRRFCATKFVTE